MKRFKTDLGQLYEIESVSPEEDGWHGVILWIQHGPQPGKVSHSPATHVHGAFETKELAIEACHEFARKYRPE